MKNIIIAGRIGIDGKEKKRGLMAELLVEQFTNAGIAHIRVDGGPFPSVDPDSIVVFLGTMESLPGVVWECAEHRFPLIIASSGIKADQAAPPHAEFPVIMAPNLDPVIMALFGVLSRFGRCIQKIGAKAYIAEGHQKTKTSEPGTAQKIAGYFGIPSEAIGSMRSDAIAGAVLGIPEESHGGFGAHFIAASNHGTRVRISFDTQGRLMYFYGLMLLINQIEKFEEGLPPGVHHADELLFSEFK